MIVVVKGTYKYVFLKSETFWQTKDKFTFVETICVVYGWVFLILSTNKCLKTCWNEPQNVLYWEKPSYCLLHLPNRFHSLFDGYFCITSYWGCFP